MSIKSCFHIKRKGENIILNNVLFLDIDGVLNSNQYYQKRSILREYMKQQSSNDLIDHLYFELDEKCVKLLNKIIHKTGCTICLSSSWRALGLKRVNKNLKDIGFVQEIKYKTDRSFKDRGEEINDFIVKYGVKNYVVLDDEGFDILNYVPKERFIKTEFWDNGLKNKHVQKIIKILKKG